MPGGDIIGPIAFAAVVIGGAWAVARRIARAEHPDTGADCYLPDEARTTPTGRMEDAL